MEGLLDLLGSWEMLLAVAGFAGSCAIFIRNFFTIKKLRLENNLLRKRMEQSDERLQKPSLGEIERFGNTLSAIRRSGMITGMGFVLLAGFGTFSLIQSTSEEKRDLIFEYTSSISKYRNEAALLVERNRTLQRRLTTQQGAANDLRAELAVFRNQYDLMVKEVNKLKSQLESSVENRLERRLQNALSQIAAQTSESARGYVINLPDFLFDENSVELRHEARLVLAKLAGILLILQDLKLRIEGHTDPTEQVSNLRLSQDRAEAVSSFLALQGIAQTRIKTAAYGSSRPVSDNSTPEGRRLNRRVEIIITESETEQSKP